jgi:phage gp16-like protein
LKENIMHRENWIVTRLKDRVARKRKELIELEEKRDELTIQIAAIEMGLDEDEKILANAQPKTPRAKKAKREPQNIEQQLDSGPMTGGE